MRCEWLLATRFLREGRVQSLFIIVGAAIGVAVIVFMSALLDGMQGNLFRRVLSSQPHIVLERPKDVARSLAAPGPQNVAVIAQIQTPQQRPDTIDQWQKVGSAMSARRDIDGVAAIVSGSAIIVRGAATASVSVTGIEPDSYARIVPLPDKVSAGVYRLGTTDMLVGQQLAADLGVAPGDRLRLEATGGAALTLRISALLDLGSRAANQRAVYVLLSTAQNLLQRPGAVSAIHLTLRDPFQAEIIAHSLADQTRLEALSWIATNNQFFVGLNAQRFTSELIRLFVGLSVAAGIASVLVVSVVQRSRDIGILRAMGGSRGLILRVFLLQGAIVGLLGSLAGSAMAALLLVLWRGMARNPDGTPMFDIDISLGLYLLAALLASVPGLLAAMTPAIRAARLQPVEAIRG